MTYRVEIDPRATVEIEEAYLWLAERAPMGAIEWFNDLHLKSHKLPSNL